MHRRPLLALLERYLALHPVERDCVARIRELVRKHPDCFERSCAPGHVTASAWIVCPERRRVLLTHHRKLDRWLQLGGHADGDPDVRRVALREAREESGLRDFELVGGADALPLDVDVHPIPAHGGEPAHEHHDVRFLLVAQPGQAISKSDESHALAWFEPDRLERELPNDGGLWRMLRKSRARLSGG